MSGQRFAALGAFLTALGVIAGAFGAHGLGERLTELGTLDTWQTGAQYHLIHGVGLVLTGLALERNDTRTFRIAAWCFLVGIPLFSGSLYGLALKAGGWLGPITPLGGSAFIVGWICLGTGFWSLNRHK
jgi:uncharacterized membrane protein YgdD (TMEM256/DUF423 family)